MKYNFDEIVDRSGRMALKYDFAGRGMPTDTIPLWIADMDFRTAPAVSEALAEHASHGIFGYSDPDADFIETVISWLTRRLNWTPKAEWYVGSPGIVVALYLAVHGLTKKGDAILLQQPVYHPFEASIEDNDRRLVVSELVNDGTGYYTIDFDDFERKIVDENVKLFVLSSPHNPVGRVFNEPELIRMGEICVKHNVVVFDDEIHADFIFPGNKHLVFSNLREDFADISITATSPSKTFNLAGLQLSNLFIKNKTIRDAWKAAYVRSGLSQLPVTGLIACKAAYTYGDDWLDELLIYLKGNIDLLDAWAKSEPGVTYKKPEGTYLAWLDFRALGLSDKELQHLFINEAHIWLSPGYSFGAGGSGFMRANLALPRARLEEALSRISVALAKV